MKCSMFNSKEGKTFFFFALHCSLEKLLLQGVTENGVTTAQNKKKKNKKKEPGCLSGVAGAAALGQWEFWE